MWTYSGRYVNPQTGVKQKYIPDDKVIMMTKGARLDATWGAIPRLTGPDSRVLPYLPSRISNSQGGMDFFTNAWYDQQSENLSIGIKSRPALIPVDIDSFGCIYTGV